MATLTSAVTINGRTAVDMTAGDAPTATVGDTWSNTGQEFLAVYNPDEESLTVALTVNQKVDGLDVDDKTITSDKAFFIIGPFPVGIYNAVSTGLAKVVVTGTTTNVKLKLFRVGY